ncbi:LysR family transcriptional regulator [Agrobacterium vitis]|nr:LysR family transcriptional regulator [Allorhizobium ampelinum]MCF1484808.1 LysR family transcriptional regulator [Allorhizobium ampelinum]MCM2450853.1 LysR family transcriptional regulator [Agrobacterium vitis]MCM2471522.1 LysR family transcriptional regulator [Agrobacterium vitis]MUO71936.1 LysR family transcriptional regulator [Agrobacterium vitis]
MREEISNRLASLSIRDLMLVLAVHRCGGFRAAAEEMGISASGLSHQVRKAETVLGTTVFERGARKVTPTDAGGDILRRIGMLLQQVAALGHETSRRTGAFGGRLRVGMISTVGPFLIPQTVGFVHKRYPRLELAFMEGKHEGLSRRLKEGEIDLVITACPVLDEAFQQVELLNEPFHLLTSVDNPVIQRDQIEPADLAKLDLLPLSEDDFPMSTEDSTLRFADRSNGPILRSYGLSIETRIRLVREQGYSCLVPSIACGQSINGTQFALAEIKGNPVRRQIFALWRRSSPYPVDLESFAKELAILLKEGQRSVRS